MVDLVFLPMQDLPLDDERMPDVLAELRAQSVHAVRRQPEGAGRGCYYTVQARVNHAGGESVNGWMIETVPGVYIQMMHHCIWKTPEGRLIDLTPAQLDNDTRESVTTFVPDGSIVPDTTWPPLIANRHIVLVKDADVRRAIAAYQENNGHMKWFWAELQKDGRYSLNSVGGVSGPPYPPHIAANDRRLKKSQGELHRMNRRILRRYFPHLRDA
ncbi:hypothetical protein [Methylorubrum extorquens]|uniref:Uncharacterized protein n=1 Tax=Methylorubrum extorquens (strain CM4 / NCIMB 13688) TaxID=440085 RepID=B7KSW9_METC4|nr:hypothetical protein [Methylorubrum extorquens]ACK82471.1 hypothetical protein Mchl_1607 [Methylorubrum extorquens CM4]